jgi:hypothetical protein
MFSRESTGLNNKDIPCLIKSMALSCTVLCCQTGINSGYSIDSGTCHVTVEYSTFIISAQCYIQPHLQKTGIIRGI